MMNLALFFRQILNNILFGLLFIIVILVVANNLKMLKFILLTYLLLNVISIPFDHQQLLANSLIVGRDDQSDLVVWTCKVCDQTNKPLRSHFVKEDIKDVKCIISVYNDYVVLAFRYTNSAQNVWQDILYPIQVVDQNTCKNCKVQKAYNTMWNTIRDIVKQDLIDIKNQTKLKKLFITGISLGGGLSVISYIDIITYQIFDTVEVVTFGAPRVGNKHWAEHFDVITNGKTLRYIVKGDPVVVLPRCLTLLCTYRQTGKQIVCHENEKLCIEDGNVPDEFTDTMLKRMRYNLKEAFQIDSDIKNMKSLADHTEGYPKIYNHTLTYTS